MYLSTTFFFTSEKCQYWHKTPLLLVEVSDIITFLADGKSQSNKQTKQNKTKQQQQQQQKTHSEK